MSNAPSGSGDMFLKIKGAQHGVIKGESADGGHQEEIQIIGWSWGMAAQRSLYGGSARGQSSINDLKIVKKVDKSSTGLMLALRTNEPIEKAVLTVRKAGTSQLEYLKITIEQGRILTLDIDGGGEAGGSDLLERLTMSFNKITVEYTPQGPDGQARGAMTFTDQQHDTGA